MNKALTHEEYFTEELHRGIHNGNPSHMKAFNLLAMYLRLDLEAKTVYEIGCGTGALLEACATRGVMAIGCDANPYHHSYFINRNPDLYDRFILTDKGEIHGQYDVIVSIEVFEHLTDKQIEWYMEQARGKARYFVFSSTSTPDPEWDERWGHINLKSQAQWHKLMERYGYQRCIRIGIPTEWTTLYVNFDGAYFKEQ